MFSPSTVSIPNWIAPSFAPTAGATWQHAHLSSESNFCQFLLDYEEDEDESEGDGSSGARRKKMPWRYRWPDDFSDEALARLLELNEQRYKEEQLAGAASAPAKSTTKRTTNNQQTQEIDQARGRYESARTRVRWVTTIEHMIHNKLNLRSSSSS